jgi:hypothetical protein
VICEVPAIEGKRELLRGDDPSRATGSFSDSCFVRREQVYLRKKTPFDLPFALLGRPPVSVWLPAGEYEIAVVHQAPRSEPRIDSRSHGFPLVTVVEACSLAANRKSELRIFLPHHDWGNGTPILPSRTTATEAGVIESELKPILDSIPQLFAVPSPSGYLLSLPEPHITHRDDHRDCVGDFSELHAVPREWTRQQIATLRNWLPTTASEARTKLDAMISTLGWRDFLQGSLCYLAAGISGLVFTKWGALLILEPRRRRTAFADSFKLLAKIFFLSMAAWFVVSSLPLSS